jgi:hypothetical protein
MILVQAEAVTPCSHCCYQSSCDSVKDAPTDIDTSGISHGAVTSSWLSRVGLNRVAVVMLFTRPPFVF